MHNLHYTSKQLTLQIISLTLVLSNLFFFFFSVIKCFQSSTLQLLSIQCQVLHTSLAETQHNARPSPARVLSYTAVAWQNAFGIQQIQTDSVATSHRKNALNTLPVLKRKKPNSLHLQTWQCIPSIESAMQEEKNDNIYITFSHIVVVSQKAVVNFPCVRVLAHLQQDYSACLSAVDW